MESLINIHNIKNFAYVNDDICKMPVSGIVISFFGLGGMDMYSKDTAEGEFYARRGILYVVPYNNPWAWMNRQAVAYTDEIIDVLMEKYSPECDLPIVSTGGSMGGQSALIYTAYAKRKPVACVANCPVCDVVFHYTERPDLPRTLYSALFNEQGSLDEALMSISPIHIIDKMPRSEYHIFHCDRDMTVNIDAHSRKFVAGLREKNFNCTFDVVPGRGHCDLTEDMVQQFTEYAVNAIEKNGMSTQS